MASFVYSKFTEIILRGPQNEQNVRLIVYRYENEAISGMAEHPRKRIGWRIESRLGRLIS